MAAAPPIKLSTTTTFIDHRLLLINRALAQGDPLTKIFT